MTPQPYDDNFLTCTSKHGRGTFPGFVDKLIWQICKFRTPFLNIAAVGVTGHRCIDRVHDKVPVIQTTHAPVLPHHSIYGNICIHQGVLNACKCWIQSVSSTYCAVCCCVWYLHSVPICVHVSPGTSGSLLARAGGDMLWEKTPPRVSCSCSSSLSATAASWLHPPGGSLFDLAARPSAGRDHCSIAEPANTSGWIMLCDKCNSW